MPDGVIKRRIPEFGLDSSVSMKGPISDRSKL